MSADQLSIWLQQLTHPDSSERRSAAEALAAADERAVYPLIRSLGDDNPGVQDAAMNSITAIGGESTTYMVLPLLRGTPFLRNAARIILRQIGQPAVPLLRSLLADKDDDIRTFAVDLISDIGWCDYVPDITRLLKTDPNHNVRASAARALGTLGYRDGAPVLIAALKDNEWVCFSALESLSLLADESCIVAVLELVNGPSETLRYAAIEALGRIGSSKTSAALIDRLPNASAMEKYAIIKSLVQIGITPSMAEVADLLIEMFSKGDWEERLIALTGLADLRDQRAIPVILDVAGSLDPSDPASEERLTAVKQALAKFDCIAALTSVVGDPGFKFRGKVIAIEVIGNLKCQEAVPHLIAMMDGDLREVRRASVVAMAEIRGDKAVRALRNLIGDRDGHVRRAAISALGRMGDKDSFLAMLARIDVENYKDVLEESVQALLRIDSNMLFSNLQKFSHAIREMIGRYAGSLDILLALSRDRELGVKLAALSSLGRVREQQAAERLSEALRDESPEARKTAVIALGALNCRFDDLKTVLGDTDTRVRLAAVEALGGSGHPEAAKVLIPLLCDRDVPVVLATIETLIQLRSGEAVKLSALQNHPDAAVRDRVAEVMDRERLC